MPRTKEEILKDILYCAMDAKSDNYHRNYGNESEILNHLYNHLSEFEEVVPDWYNEIEELKFKE